MVVLEICKIESVEKNYLAQHSQHSDPTFLAADLVMDWIYYFHLISTENISSRKRSKSFSWRLKSAMFMEGKEVSLGGEQFRFGGTKIN